MEATGSNGWVLALSDVKLNIDESFRPIHLALPRSVMEVRLRIISDIQWPRSKFRIKDDWYNGFYIPKG